MTGLINTSTRMIIIGTNIRIILQIKYLSFFDSINANYAPMTSHIAA